LPVGTQLLKKRWDWGYQINGKFEHDYAIAIFNVILFGALLCFLLWIGFKWCLALQWVISHNDRRQN